MFRFLDLIFIISITFVECAKLHEQFADEKIHRDFRTKRENAKYYITMTEQISRYKRPEKNLRIKVNTLGIDNAYDVPTTRGILARHDTPVWRAFSNFNGTVTYEKMLDGIVGFVAEGFENFTNLSSILEREDKKGRSSFHGNLSDNFKTVPLPERLRQTSENIVKTLEERQILALEKNVLELSQVDNETNGSRFEHSLPEIIYPSILITTDYHDTKKTRDDVDFYDEILYQLAFWNGVNLRLRHLKNPKVKLRIAGIIIGQDQMATWWIKYHMNGNKFDGNLALPQMQRWEGISKNLSDYNILVTMTDSKMYQVKGDGTEVNMLEMSMNRLCSVFDDRPARSNAIIVDHRRFDGILPATRTLGRIFGASYDEFENGICDKSMGYIMSPDPPFTVNSFKWSVCSLSEISSYLRRMSVSCDAANFDHHGTPISTILPGIVMSASAQCQARGHYSIAHGSYVSSMCQKLQCTDLPLPSVVWSGKNIGPSVDGTICNLYNEPCPQDFCIGVCVDGKCLKVPKEAISKKQPPF